MGKFWIFLGILFSIVLAIALGCAIWDKTFRPWFINGMVYIFGETGKTFTGYWSGIMATPFYLQWHPLIWVGVTIVGAIIFVKALWPRLRQTKQATSTLLKDKISLQREPAEPEQAPIATKTEKVPQETEPVTA